MNAPWNVSKIGGGVAQRETFAAFVCDQETIDAMRPVVNELGWPPERINKGGLRNAVQTLSVSSSPQILVIDLSEASDPINDISSLAEVCEPGTLVVAIGMTNDVQLYRDLLTSGLHDYILKPLAPEILREALLNAQAALQGAKAVHSEDEAPHRSTAVIGVRGGVGASTLAASLAWMVADRLDKPTGLLDLDIHFGIGALQFDLEPGRGLTDALENPSRIDSLFIDRAMVKVNDNLSVLSAEAPINTPLMMDGTALHYLQEELKNGFDNLIVDLPREMAVAQPHLLAEMNSIIVVTEMTLAATRDTIRLLGFLKAAAPSANVVLVANKVGNAASVEVSKKDFEASIERKVDIQLPYDAKATVNAAKLGRCVAEASRDSKLAGQLKALMAKILGGDVEASAPAKAPAQALKAKLSGLSGIISKSAK